MVEIAGHSYEVVVGSDVQRDGEYLEAWNDANSVVAEVFYKDHEGLMTSTAYLPDLPLPLVEWMIGEAKVRIVPEPASGN